MIKKFEVEVCVDPDELSEEQRRHFDHWVRPEDICKDPKMVHLISSSTVKQVLLP